MKIKVNGEEINPKAYSLLATNDLLLRQFRISVLMSMGFKKKDKVEIENGDGTLLISGEVEAVDKKEGGIDILVGRNKVSSLLHKQAEKTVQFKKGMSLKTIFDRALEGMGVEVIGDVALPKELLVILEEGTRIVDFCLDLASKLGFSVYSNNENKIVIGENLRTTDTKIDREKNLLHSVAMEKDADVFTKITVKGKSSLTENNDDNRRNSATAGSGEKAGVISYLCPLQKSECEEIAKRFLYQNTRRTKILRAYLSPSLNLDVDDVCAIGNKGIKEKMRVSRIERNKDDQIEELICFFEVLP